MSKFEGTVEEIVYRNEANGWTVLSFRLDGSGRTSAVGVLPFLAPGEHVILEGDLVELISGPFKGEKARVQQIDQTKEEITVELIEAMVPIPVTVKGDSVRVIEKEK